MCFTLYLHDFRFLQDYLICIEMFVASIAFNYTFTYREFVIKSSSRRDSDEGEDSQDEVATILSSLG